MAGLFKISDQSATNSRGAYADMLLDYDQIQATKSDAKDGEVASGGDDSQMVLSEEGEMRSDSNGKLQLSLHVILSIAQTAYFFLSRNIRQSLRVAAILQQSGGVNDLLRRREWQHRTGRIQTEDGDDNNSVRVIPCTADFAYCRLLGSFRTSIYSQQRRCRISGKWQRCYLTGLV